MSSWHQWCVAVIAFVGLAAGPLQGAIDVRKFGARGDGAAKDTGAIQKAIDKAASLGGGTVTLPPGRYLSGTLHLRSRVTLRLENGATLAASPDNADFDPYERLDYATPDDRETTYFHYALLAGENVEDLAIVGEGTIDGNRPVRGGPKPIALKLCRRVTIEGITIRRAPNYAISLLGTDYVNVEGVTMVECYADGIDPDSCRHVRISNVYFDGWDDAIVAKASHALGYRRSTEDLTVTNCVLTTNSCYLKFGSESGGDFKNIAFTNVACYRRRGADRRNLSVIDLESNDGANVDGVVISNIVAQDVYKPFSIRLGNRGRGPSREPGTVRNISISNFVARNASVAGHITGLPGRPVENVALENVRISVVRPTETEAELAHFPGVSFQPQAAYAVVVQHAAGLRFSNVEMRWEQEDMRPAMVFDDVRDAVLDGVRVGTAAGEGPVLSFNNVAGALIEGCRAPKAAGAFLRVTGARSGDIRLMGNDLGRVGKAVELKEGVARHAVAEVRSGGSRGRGSKVWRTP
jgi:polygalacturonase